MTPMPHRHVLSWLPLFLSLATACGSGTGTSVNTPGKVDVVFENQSQFDIEGILAHNGVDDYDTQANLLTSPLPAGQKISATIANQLWYVTVLRRPNKDASPLAYTMGRSWNPQSYPRLIYLDEQFRAAARAEQTLMLR